MLNKRETAGALGLIAMGNALNAEVEYELEDRGLITTDDSPYATLTNEGHALLYYAEAQGLTS